MRLRSGSLAVCVLFGMIACSLAACNRERGVEAAREGRPAAVSAAEQDFMKKATQGNLAEIDMARIALQKSSNKDIKDYANMIQSDHTRALEDLTDLMRDKNVPEPKELPETQRNAEQLNNFSSADFDREFLNRMVSDHEKTIEMFRDTQSKAQNADVKKYIDDWLPKFQMHLDKARQLQTKMFGTGAPTSR